VKAAVCHAFGEPLSIEEVRLGEPAGGELVVDLRACAICHSDISYADGYWGGTLPAIYGHEAAGVVSAVGRGVTGIGPGDRVVVSLIRSCGSCYFCSRGDPVQCEAEFRLAREPVLWTRDGRPIHQAMRVAAFAERVLVHASQVAVVGEEIDFAVAATLGCGVLTGVGAAVNTARLRPGDSVVVLGAGGVGLNAIQGAVLCGAEPVIAVDPDPRKRAAALEFGATDAIDPAAADPRDAVAERTGGRLADCVLVAVGSTAAIGQGTGLMRRGGQTVVVGLPPAGETVCFDPTNLADAGQSIVGSKMGSSRVGVDIPALVAQYRAGRLKLDQLVSERRPLEEINDAIARVVAGEVLRSVIVF
jgi:S-(hydroxymethyl)glutathione dehydrogenase/alcohol dehydrogenase